MVCTDLLVLDDHKHIEKGSRVVSYSCERIPIIDELPYEMRGVCSFNASVSVSIESSSVNDFRLRIFTVESEISTSRSDDIVDRILGIIVDIRGS